MAFFVVLIYVSGYLSLVLAALSMACGLYYMAELAEEHTSTAKRAIKYLLYGLLIAHVLLLVYERFPPVYPLIGMVAHGSYLRLMKVFPLVDPKSVPFFACVLMFCASNVGWFYMFKTEAERFYQYRVLGGPSVSAFFALMVWSVPVALFVSLTVNDAMLPGATDSQRSSASRSTLDRRGGSGSTSNGSSLMTAFLSSAKSWLGISGGTSQKHTLD
ncbi:hypothetical protein FVE85_6418 [Porphyridium purpureum]|uniref:Protein SVP26 n=1 Tax=Porphyridium purpureum TaxID=35688 RepID=A0A5J4Z7L8_PORPP|nr:hypothetical protein FVE85_6418 [Porphyridium purpureum]|eukprot:POR1070..scf295_1